MPKNKFEGEIRNRVCGLIVKDKKLLLVKIQSPTMPEAFWMPPGGGVNLGETLHSALIREVQEETGLNVVPGQMVFISEYLKGKWHAIEMYFRCEIESGVICLGHDPELDQDEQMLLDICWMDIDESKSNPIFPPFIRHYFGDIVNQNDMPLRFL